MEEYVVFNGQVMEKEQVVINYEDRGYQFGDGIYEVIRVYNGKLFTAKEHLQRLEASARKIKMEIPYSIEQIEEFCIQLVEKNKIVDGIVYMQITRGVAPRNHTFSQEMEPTFLANTKKLARPIEKIEKGVKTVLHEDIRWLLCDIKSLNLIGNVLAKQAAHEAGCYEAVQHRGDIVTECGASNIAIIKDNKLITHPANNLILNGITRQVVLKLCRENGIAVEERPFTVEELIHADEAFALGTTTEVAPILKVSEHEIANGVIGPVTRKIQQLFEAEIQAQCYHKTLEVMIG